MWRDLRVTGSLRVCKKNQTNLSTLLFMVSTFFFVGGDGEDNCYNIDPSCQTFPLTSSFSVQSFFFISSIFLFAWNSCVITEINGFLKKISPSFSSSRKKKLRKY